MKKFHLTSLLLAGIVACTASLNGATSEVVGAASFDIPTGPTVVAFPFLKSADIQGAVVAVAGADITLPADASTITGPNYVHVLDGAAAGYVLDIVSVAGAVVTVSDDAAALGLLAGDSVAVRGHLTLADITTSPPAGTSVTFLDAGGSPVVVSRNGFTGLWTAPNTVIYPGEGVIWNNTVVYTATLYGLVSEYDVIFSALGGPQVLGCIDPVNGSAAVIETVKSGAFNNSVNLTELGIGGAPTVYAKNGFTGLWQTDPSLIDNSDFKSAIINYTPVDIVNAGMVIAP